MANRILLLGLLALGWFATLSLQSASIDGGLFGDKIQELVRDGLARDKIQAMIDLNNFQTQEIDGQGIIDSLTRQLGDAFKNAFEAVRRIKDAAEQGYKEGLKSQRANISKCCHVNENASGVEKLGQFGRKADIDRLCYRVSPLNPSNNEIPAEKLVQVILQASRKNFDTGTWLKWQYVGTEEGIFITFPARRDPMCSTFATRLRPWYVETATPTPRDIVFVMDTSDSMVKLMKTTKEAALTVIDTLNPNDRVGFVSFSDKARTPPGSLDKSFCYAHSLSYATPDNKEYLTSYINDLESSGGSNFTRALIPAFQLLQKSPVDDIRQRRRVMLFMTDGKPSDSPQMIQQTIRINNAALNNTVTILTFGIGPDLSQTAQGILVNMARQNFSDPEQGTVTPGVFTRVENSNNLREKLGTYYDSLGTSHSPNPIVSVPYIDFSGLGIISSVCLPVYLPDTTDLKGVACVDISLSELASSVRFFDHGQFSYAFLVDSTGRTTIHPLLPRPEAGNNPVIVNIEELERDDSVKPLLETIKSGGSGSRTLETHFLMSRGNASRDGMKKERMNATYYWRRIPDTDFILCIIIAARDKQIHVSTDGFVNDFVYHRLDILSDLERDHENVQFCSHLGRLGTSSHSVVKLTQSAFSHSDSHRLTDNSDTIKRLKYYMEGKHSDITNTGLKEGVREMVAVTAGADAIWREASTFNPYTISRYLGTYNGFIRVLPGQVLARNYDHVQRLWYKAAMANPGIIVMTTPYKDAFGAGIVITLCGIIKMGRNTHRSTDPIIGVVGMDFHMSYIKKIIVESFTRCSDPEYQCFIVDSSGYFIYRDDIDYDSETNISNAHITEKEPAISQDLIQKQHLEKQICAAVDTKQNIYTWKLSVGGALVDNLDGTPAYQLQSVQGTNMYIGIKKRTSVSGETCFCPSKFPIYSDLPKCKLVDLDHCACPCHANADFDFCNNRYSLRRDGHDPCSAWFEEPSFDLPMTNVTGRISALPACVNRTCINKEEVDCKGTVGCRWCKTDYESKKQCAELIECILSTTPSPTTPTYWTTPKPSDVAMPAAVGSVAAVIVLVIIVVLVIRLRKSGNEEPVFTENDSQSPSRGSRITEYGIFDHQVLDPVRNRSSDKDGDAPYDYCTASNRHTGQPLEAGAQASGSTLIPVPASHAKRHAPAPGTPDSIVRQPIEHNNTQGIDAANPQIQIQDSPSKTDVIWFKPK